VRRYREGAGALAAAVAGLSETELDHRPKDGGWTPREVIHHCADSEIMSAIRLRRLVAEDNPAIVGYDQELYSQRLYYDRRPVGPSLAAVSGAREATAAILDQLGEEQWARAGTHSELGPYSVDRWLEVYAAHCDDHANQIRRAVAEARGS
jgi:hypothetical protein